MELHHTAVKEETGFSAVEMLLCIIAVTLIVFTGYYVYNTKKNTDKLNTEATASLAQPAIAPKSQPAVTKTAVSGTETWATYASPGGEFSLKLADGWHLERYLKSAFIYSGTNENLAPKTGQAGVVEEVNGGKDGVGNGLVVGFYTDTNSFNVNGYETKPSFTTSTGATVEVYYYVAPANPDPQSGYVAGTQVYTYITHALNDKKKIVVASYTFNPGQTDYHQTVEQAMKTLAIL